MKTRRQSRRPSRRQSQRQSRRPSQRPRSNCKKTRQRRTFRRAQRVGGGRKSRRHRSKTLQGGVRHFNPNVIPTRDNLGFKKDIEIVHSAFLFETNKNPNYFRDKVYEFLEKKKRERNIELNVNVEAYMPEELTENAKKFIRVKITPFKVDYQYEPTKNLVQALLQNLTIGDFENAADIQSRQKQPSSRHSVALPLPKESYSDDFPLTSKNVDLGGNNATITNKLQLMAAINKIFQDLPVEYKKMLFNKVVVWLATENTVSYVPVIDEKLHEKNIKIINLSTFEKLMLYLRNTIPSEKIESFLTNTTNTTNNLIAQDIRINTGLDFGQLSSSF